MSALPENPLPDAREFYRDELRTSFRRSRLFSQPFGCVVEAVADTAPFDAVLRESLPGTFECARRIGELAVIHLDPVPKLAELQPGQSRGRLPGPWWRDLLNYERGWFLQTATTAEGPPTNRPRRGVSAVCMNFVWNLPALIERLDGEQEIGETLRQPVTLLFARAADGQVHVRETESQLAKVFRATNGYRTLEQIADAAGCNLPTTGTILAALADIGAAVLAMSPEQMLQKAISNKQ
jgi:hypothetical protein